MDTIYFHLVLILEIHCLHGMISSNSFVKLASLKVEENIIYCAKEGSVTQCSAICNLDENCDGFNWMKSTFPPTCQLIKLKEFPVTSTDTNSALYLPLDEDFPLKGNLNGPYGVWSDDLLCPEGSFVGGFLSWYENYVGTGLGHDDCGLQGIELFCQNSVGNDVGSVELLSHYLSPVKYGRVSCPSGDLVSGFQIKLSNVIVGQDEDAMTNIMMECHDSKVMLQSNTDNREGTWSSLVSCPNGMRMCGMRVKYVQPFANVTDNTCYNEVLSLCCFM